MVLAGVELLFPFVLEAMRSLFRQLVLAASPWSAVFDRAATMPSELTQVFNFPRAMLPTGPVSEFDLICRRRNDTEHKITLARPHPRQAPAELVFQARVYPLHRCTFAITHILGAVEVQQLLPLRFGPKLDLQFRVAARVDIDDRHAPRSADLLMYRWGAS